MGRTHERNGTKTEKSENGLLIGANKYIHVSEWPEFKQETLKIGLLCGHFDVCLLVLLKWNTFLLHVVALMFQTLGVYTRWLFTSKLPIFSSNINRLKGLVTSLLSTA